MNKPSREDIENFAVECCENDNNDGMCLSCGNVQGGCEPDAQRYECEACGRNNVYGGQELLMRFAG